MSECYYSSKSCLRVRALCSFTLHIMCIVPIRQIHAVQWLGALLFLWYRFMRDFIGNNSNHIGFLRIPDPSFPEHSFFDQNFKTQLKILCVFYAKLLPSTTILSTIISELATMPKHPRTGTLGNKKSPNNNEKKSS